MTTADRVGETTFATPSDTEIEMTRVFDASRALVFDAWTKPEHIPNWMLGPPGWTMPVCDVDLRVGGAWHFAWQKSGGEEMNMRGVYREVSPPERFVSTESWGPEWPETLNTVTFSEEAGRTTVVITVAYPSKEARDAALGTGMKQGMNLSFERLAAYLA
jgi:uncharacterized protein YndB with AHSA1/START domain